MKDIHNHANVPESTALLLSKNKVENHWARVYNNDLCFVVNTKGKLAK